MVMSFDRRRFLAVTGSAGVAGLAGCLGDDEDGAEFQVGMVYSTGGLGDDSFNDMAHQGAEDAEAEFDLDYENAEPDDEAEIETYQRQYADQGSYDLICCIGIDQTSGLIDNAPEYDEQNFMTVDTVIEDDDGELVDNVANYVFGEPEGSFQVGHLAGLLTGMDYSHAGGETTDDQIVGFVGGQEIPLIERFEAGYIAGVEHANPDVEVQSAYAGSWNDPSTGREIAQSMYEGGADVVYHAAGATGAGVFEIAQEMGRFAIGVDDDQSQSADGYSDVIIASMVKRVDTAVYESIEAVVEGNFEGGTVNELGLDDGGVDAVIGQEFEGAIPDEIVDALDETHNGIVSGEIDVPESLSEL